MRSNSGRASRRPLVMAALILFAVDTAVVPDPPLVDRAKRACTNCHAIFQPTAVRRLLCQSCYKRHVADRRTYGMFTPRQRF